MKGDRQVNNAKTQVLNHSTGQFEIVKWKKLKPGDVVKIEKDQQFPADILLIGAKEEIIFVDTMNLDGETNLKPRVIANELANNETFITHIQGKIMCD